MVDRSLNSLRQLLHFFLAYLQDRHELIARVSAHEVRRANVGEQQDRKLLQQLVARLMTELVIHRLEAIEVHHHYREGVTMTARAVSLFLKARAFASPVSKSVSALVSVRS